MKELVKFDCYIEEYKNQTGNLCVRLRDKETNKRIVLTGTNVDKEHLLRFLSQAKINNNLMPTVYNRGGYIKPSQFDVYNLDDGLTLSENENVHGSVIGMAVANVLDNGTTFRTRDI